MSVEDLDGRLEQRLELEGTAKEEVHRRAKTVYTREFLLSCAELDVCEQFLGGFDPPVFRRSKTAYTREFLLSCAELDVCKQLPRGFDPYVLHEPEDAFKGILKPWKGSGVLFFPNSGNSRRAVHFTGWDSSGSSWEPVGRSDCLSLRLNRESNSQGNCHSDFKRHDNPTPCSVKASGSKAEDMRNRIQETGKNDCYQLSKSENPYRPPHTYQVGSSKYEGKSPSKKTTPAEKMDSGIQEETRLKGHRIVEDKKHEIKDTTLLVEDNSSDPVCSVKPSCHDFNSLEPNVTNDDQITYFDSKKANTSPTREELNEEESEMLLKEDVGSSLRVPSCYLSSVIENAVPQPLEANSEFEMGLSGKTCFPKIEDSCSELKSSSERNTGYCQTNQSQKPISEMELNELHGNRGFYPGQRGSLKRITRKKLSGPYEFPFTIAYDLFTSVLCEDNPIRTNHQCTITADAADKIDLYDMEKNECTFDDMWFEILAILQFEQEMELSSIAKPDQTADFEVQLSLPDEDSLISNDDHPTSSEHSKFVLSDSSDNFADYDAEIHLPDKNILIAVDDLIAPEDSLISIEYPTSAGISKLVPLNNICDAEIHLPDEDSLITIDDLIARNHLKFTDSGGTATDDTPMSNVRDWVARQPGALVFTDHAKGSASHGLEAPPSLEVTALMAYQELHFWQFSLHNPGTAINPEIPVCCPFNSLEAHQTTFMDPVPLPYCPPVHWYSCPNIVHQFSWKTTPPKSKEFSQYSLLQKPTSFPQQSHLPIKQVASCNWELEKMPPFHLRHQQTAYPDSAIANSAMFLNPPGIEGFNNQMGFNRFIDERSSKA